MKINTSNLNFMKGESDFTFSQGNTLIKIPEKDLTKKYYLVKNGSEFTIKKYFLPAVIHKLWMFVRNLVEKDHYLYSKKAVEKLRAISLQKKSPSIRSLPLTIAPSPSVKIKKSNRPDDRRIVIKPTNVQVREKLEKISENAREKIESVFGSSEQLMTDLGSMKITVLNPEGLNVPLFLLKPFAEGSFGVVCDRLDLDTGALDCIKQSKDTERAKKDLEKEWEVSKKIHGAKKSSIWGLQDLVHKIDCYQIGLPPKTGLLCTKCLSDLSAFIKKEDYSQRNLSSKLSICHQLLSGLKLAHDKEIVHGDLKTKNILLKSIENRGEEIEIPIVQIADWGGSMDKIRPSGVTLSRRWTNRDDYNILFDHSIDFDTRMEVGKKHDVFSMGIILYTVLKGKRPFEKDGNFPELSSYSSINPLNEDGSLSPLDQLIKSMLDSDREKRPTIKQAYKAFEKTLGEELLEIIKQQKEKVEGGEH